jgi:hypothetical protein
MKKSDLPILPPVRVEVLAGATDIISFPNRFFGSAVSIKIQNNDSGNACTYRTGGETQPLVTLGASQFDTVDDTIINLLEVTAGAGGTVTVSAQVVLDPRSNQAIPESVI